MMIGTPAIAVSFDNRRAATGLAALNTAFNDKKAALFIADGQSNSQGAKDSPILVSGELAYAANYLSGPRPTDGGTASVAEVQATMAALKVFQEHAVSGAQSTQLGPAFEMIRQMLAADYGFRVETSGKLFMGVAVGVGGTAIATLSTEGNLNDDGTGSLPRALYAIGNAGTHADTYGGYDTYAGAIACLFDQGESDTIQGTAANTWEAGVDTIQDAFEAENLATLGGAQACPFVMAQKCTHLADDVTTPSIALKQLEMEGASGDCMRLVPTHGRPYGYTPSNAAYRDEYHYTPQWQTAIGAQMGLQIYYRIFRGLDGIGIRAGSATTDGSTVTIPLSWLSQSRANTIVEDTTVASGLQHYGFQLVDTNGDPVAITASRIDGTNIELDYSSGTPTRWRYAWARASAATASDAASHGRIRDDDRHVFRVGAYTFRLYSWLPICDGAITGP